MLNLNLGLAESAGCFPLVAETYTQEVVDLVLNKKGRSTQIFWIVSEIQECLKGSQQIRIQHTLRICNEVSHSLPQIALEQANAVS